MKIIKRFDLQIEPVQNVDIPFNSEIIHFGVWEKFPAIWVLVDTGFQGMTRKLVVFADNKEVSPRFNKTNHVGSFKFQAEVGATMLHMFEE